MRSTLIPACSLGGSALPAGRLSSLMSARTMSRETAARNRVTRIQATRDDPSPALAAHPADAAIPPAGRDVHPACGMDALSGPWWGVPAGLAPHDQRGEAAMRTICVSLPVRNLAVSKAFFAELGVTFSRECSGEGIACIIVDQNIYVMLVAEDRFRHAVDGEIRQATAGAAPVTGLSAGSAAGSGRDGGEGHRGGRQAVADHGERPGLQRQFPGSRRPRLATHLFRHRKAGGRDGRLGLTGTLSFLAPVLSTRHSPSTTGRTIGPAEMVASWMFVDDSVTVRRCDGLADHCVRRDIRDRIRGVPEAQPRDDAGVADDRVRRLCPDQFRVADGGAAGA